MEILGNFDKSFLLKVLSKSSLRFGDLLSKNDKSFLSKELSKHDIWYIWYILILVMSIISNIRVRKFFPRLYKT